MKKPHIYYRGGYWHVSKMTKPYHKHSDLWRKAYQFIYTLHNNKE